MRTAQDLVKEGLEGKWLKVSAEERDSIIESIADANFLRNKHAVAGSGTGGDNLRHYIRGEHICVHGTFAQAEEHPDDLAARKETEVAAAKAVLASHGVTV